MSLASNKLPREKAERLLVSLVNAKFDGVADVTRLRTQTGPYWPDLWGWIDDEPGKGETRALEIVKKIRWYLQQFWKSTDPYERDWYIQRIRDYHHRHLILPETKGYREALGTAPTADEARGAHFVLDLAIEQALDKPPRKTPFSESLYFLQQLKDKARFCQNEACTAPYFIGKKNQPYHQPSCADGARRQYKSAWWANHPEANERRRQKRRQEREQRKEIENAKRSHRKNH